MKELWEKAIDHLLSYGDWAEVFYSAGYSMTISTEDKKLYRAVRGESVGVGLRLIKGDRTYYGYTSDLSESAVMEVAREISVDARKKEIGSTVFREPEKGEIRVEINPREVSTAEKASLVRRIDTMLWNETPLLRQVSVSLIDGGGEIEILNSDGLWIKEKKSRVLFSVGVVVQKDGELQTGRESVGAVAGWEYIKETSVEEVAMKALRRAILMLEAKPAPAGKMPVVISSAAGGTIIHEAVGHGLEADIVLKESSVYAGQLGKQVASEIVTLVDDGSMDSLWGSGIFDGEGVRTKKNVLIENGILKKYLTDRLMSRITGWELTGNGRRQSFKFYPIPRMTNTYLQPGDTEPEEIVSRVKNGIFVKKVGGGQVNPTTGDFVFKILEGYIIEDGRVGRPIKGATITGNGPDVLKNVKAIGKDLEFQIGTCGKDGQGVPVTDAQPTMLVPDLVIGGVDI